MEKTYLDDSGSSKTESGREINPQVNCHHNMKSILRVVRNGVNAGKKYHVCSLWPNDNCGFFKWGDGSEVMRESEEFDALENHSAIVVLEFKKRMLKEKIKKLQVENVTLKKKVQETTKVARQLRHQNLEMIKEFGTVLNLSKCHSSLCLL
ncbi:unnamed protein product [Cuscuta europaea]|uniref:GRF-type domain-containing protein n=1 Tax=Cuscuta europaea TaxID=41803 RepID=A0A9P0YRV1_CUSEU|nr:unnamed protein product [Cuscuta europaea]